MDKDLAGQVAAQAASTLPHSVARPKSRQNCGPPDHRHRQVMVDVGIHACERELDRLDPRCGPLPDKRPPITWATEVIGTGEAGMAVTI
ncbi:MAG TPA: hypothetical protein DHU96_06705 [Actinobacteria bacterium]|nr:hypothetical protein [Actinomycetota bacterium]